MRGLLFLFSLDERLRDFITSVCNKTLFNLKCKDKVIWK